MSLHFRKFMHYNLYISYGKECPSFTEISVDWITCHQVDWPNWMVTNNCSQASYTIWPNTHSVNMLLKMGESRPLFIYFCSFQQQFLQKNVCFSGIRTQIVGEAPHFEHINNWMPNLITYACAACLLTHRGRRKTRLDRIRGPSQFCSKRLVRTIAC